MKLMCIQWCKIMTGFVVFSLFPKLLLKIMWGNELYELKEVLQSQWQNINFL